jgi:DNA-binding XRE family transcriptional regulator
MKAVERRSEDQIRPAEVRLQEAAIALLFERIARLDKERKDDLTAVFLEWLDDPSHEASMETERTMRELLFPELAGELGSSWGVEPDAELKLRSWSTGVGTRIKSLRCEKNWTQNDLAERSGLPQSHISRIEGGKHTPSHKTVVAIANALGVDVRDIDPMADAQELD